MLGAAALAQRIASHRLLDRLIRGRAWIALVAFALLGIVVLQLALLKLNTSIGRSIEREGVLQNQNAAISIENSELTSGGRVEASAGHLGMSLVPTSLLKFLDAHPRHDAARAASVLSTPLQSSAPSETAVAASAGSEEAGSESSSSEASSESASSSSESSSESSSSEASAGASSTSEGEGATGGEASPTG